VGGDAGALPEGGVPTEEELLELLGQAARRGSVPAIKELLAYHRKTRGGGECLFTEFDELAKRRGRAVEPR
jgi:hypothetical protein